MKYTILITSVFLSSAAYSAQSLGPVNVLDTSFSVCSDAPRSPAAVYVPVETIGLAFSDGDQDLSGGESFQGGRVQIAGRFYKSFIKLLVEAPTVHDAIRQSYTVDDAVASLGHSGIPMHRKGGWSLKFLCSNGIYSFSNELLSVTLLPIGF